MTPPPALGLAAMSFVALFTARAYRDNFMLGGVFTSISVVRQYALRRGFNARIHALAARIDTAKP